MDDLTVCEGIKINISSSIIDIDLVKYNEALYFSKFNYDIYNESDKFYTDVCAPASINENDITLADRKKYYSISNVSLCNETCNYIDVDFATKRFICECIITSNFSDNNINKEKREEEELSNKSYILSFINYKINVCYKFFFLEFRKFLYNFGFYISIVTIFCYFLNIIIFFKMGKLDINKKIFENIPSKKKLKKIIKEKKEKENNIKAEISSQSIFFLPKNTKINKIELSNNIQDKKDISMIVNNKNILKSKKKVLNLKKSNLKVLKINKANKNIDKSQSIINSNKESSDYLKTKFKRNRIKVNFNIENNIKKENLITNINNNYKKNKNKIIITSISDKKIKQFKKYKASLTSYDDNNVFQNDLLRYLKFTNDNEVDEKDLNTIPFTQALRIDKRNFFKMFISILAHKISIINIFYYKNPFQHLSITLSIYIFELSLDLGLNCLLYIDDYVSQKYHNNGNIEFITSLTLSFISNVFASLISFILGKLANYDEIFEDIIKNISTKRSYFLYIVKFKEYVKLKIILFFIIEILFNTYICYYMIVFCFVYQKSQGNIMINYIIGIAESIAISLILAIIISLIRYLSIIKEWKSFYNTSKYLYENF